MWIRFLRNIPVFKGERSRSSGNTPLSRARRAAPQRKSKGNIFYALGARKQLALNRQLQFF
ncbi:hypothetical protein [Paenibacillus sp. BK720]|uniref:hypothetical protein n=1 Tax=Paenibacillus sp. BK720 TaxID=2587092 RepID=UPI001ABB38D2|nr:hypothetical protein [Paenibacillus sp. BK720]